jgi:isochorismate synthase
MAMNVVVDPDVIADAVIARPTRTGSTAVIIPGDAALRGAEVLAALPDGDRALWWQPDRQLLVVGSGVAGHIGSPAGTGVTEAARFGAIPFSRFVGQITVLDPYETSIGPRLIGGFSFFADDFWEAFGTGHLVLPRLSYIREGASAAWVVVVDDSDVTDIVTSVDRVMLGIQALDRRAEAAPLQFDGNDRAETARIIEAAIDEVRSGRLEKIVVARTATAEGTVDVPNLLDTLAGLYAECATFAFERNGQWFVGATPELLARKDRGVVASAALAATAPRHDDPVLDRIELESLTTTKQLEEHRLVVDAVAAALEGLGITATAHEQQVMELRHVRHLLTGIEGPVADDVGLLEVVGALHPTPAVGGVPGSGALEWIRSNEGFTRGWYAAPVGVMDLEGDGEFRVALRSARITDTSVHLYAGAGIVAGSDPDAEIDEIELKLGVMSGAIEAAQ